MSVDLAVWEGLTPPSDAAAAELYERLYARYVDTDEPTPPTDRIRAYVDALLARFPDLTELGDDELDRSPWADGPLIENASGPFLYFAMVTGDLLDEAWANAVATARELGLVAFDPQSERLAR